MYTISKDENGGVVLLCQGVGCKHTEIVNEYDESIGSTRTQAARAMQKHAREQHGAKELKPAPKGYGVMGRW